MENWKLVAEFDNLYEISNYGNLRSIGRYVVTGKNKDVIKNIKPRNILTQNNGKGYLQYYISIDNKRKVMYAHRLVSIYFLIKESDALTDINHKDGVKSNNHFENLEWCTKKQNSAYAIKTGLKLCKKGEDVSQSKLKNKDVIRIRQMANDGIFHKHIAKEFSISIGYVSNIVKKIKWKHI